MSAQQQDDCIEEQTLWRYASGDLAESEARAVSLHCAGCDGCAERASSILRHILEARRWTPEVHAAAIARERLAAALETAVARAAGPLKTALEEWLRRGIESASGAARLVVGAAGEAASLTTEGLRWLVSPDATFASSSQRFAVAGMRTRGPTAATIALGQPEGRSVVVTLERGNCLVRFLGYSAEEIPPPVLLPAGAGTEAHFAEWDALAQEWWVRAANDARMVVVGPTAFGHTGDRDESG